ncbi:glycosyltransferase [Amycolatopsis arida]|uniref:Glycosyltransferase n=1 Tax=Amycolatopsis arida TaxID=587909 RepID=A0A1I5QDR0_9PSEU|nr:nucleotide disphospho-sugar-binding domain-containing protein [Amycolatopsis arida]TDX98802.1 glycosyltransferase [Amycolatopsis arida]SFP44405.1 glycosyltransferase [Amycolatopsis arida]
MRVLLTSVPLPGHFFPLVPLAWVFRALGHDVLVAVPATFVPAACRSGLPVVPCGPAMDFVELAAATAGSGDAGTRRYAHGRVFGRIAAAALPGVTGMVGSWRPDLVVSERAEFAGPIAAAVSGVPRVELHWGAARLGEYRAAAAEVLAGALAARGLARLPEPDRVLNPWPPSLRRPYAAAHRNLRHVSYNGDARMPGWSVGRAAPARICLTLGTVVPRLPGTDGAAVVSIVDQLAGLGVEVVVAVDEAVAAGWRPLPAAVRHVGATAAGPDPAGVCRPGAPRRPGLHADGVRGGVPPARAAALRRPVRQRRRGGVRGEPASACSPPS